MGTAVAIRGGFGSLEKMRSYGRNLVQGAAFGGSDLEGKDLLVLDHKEGYWRFGQESGELTEKDLLAVNPMSFQHGYVAFGKEGMAVDLDGNPAQVMVSADFTMPNRDDLPELELVRFKRGEPEREPDWKLCRSVDLVVVEGPNKGQELRYAPTSRGGTRMVLKLQAEVGRRFEAEDLQCVPLVELFAEPYKHRTYGKIFNPIAEIIEWTDLEDDGTTAQKHPKKGEKTAKGAPVDTRKGSRDDEDDEPEDKPRGRRGRDEDNEPKRTTKGRRGRDEDAEAEEEEEAPRVGKGRRGRGDDDGEKPARGRSARRGRDEDDEPEEDNRRERKSSRRSRDEEDEPEDKPRGKAARRGRDEEDEPEDNRRERKSSRRGREEPEEEEAAGPRGRRASAGGRSRH